MINHLNLLLDKFKEDINLKISNNSKKKIKLANIIDNNNKNRKFADIDQ